MGNLRVDQAWGSAQIMAAYHDVNPAYYLGLGTTQLQAISGGPDDHKAGWAVGLGFKLNTPFFGQGDYIQTQFNYTQGALRYVFQTPNSNWGINEGSNASLGSCERWGLWRLRWRVRLRQEPCRLASN